MQEQNGVFTGPGSYSEEASVRQQFLHNYHTTLVGILACALFSKQ
jgi:hypothetical protein